MTGTQEDQECPSVKCPVCHGGKLNMTKTAPCLCCKGAGEIPSKMAEALSRIRSDLKGRLLDGTRKTK